MKGAVIRQAIAIEKRDCLLRRVCPSVRPSERMEKYQLSLDRFLYNLLLEYFSKIYREYSRFIRI
jgi:hypothetical protein